MTYLAFVRKERRLLSFAVSFTFFSSFGQTFLISLFVPYFLTAFDLSNATFGSLYSAATLTSAVALPWLGQWIDRIPLRQYSMYVAIGLLIASLVMAVSWHISMLFIGLILLRLSGQGLSGHTAQTTMARYNDQLRGKALSISGIGYPLGEAILPSIIAGVLVLFHWRTTWALIAMVIAIFFIPVLWFLIRSEKTAVDDEIIEEDKPSASDQYKLLARDARTWYVVPAILMPPFWVTGLFLYQVSAADQLGWSAALIASAFVAFAATRIATGLFSGPVIDRFSAKTIFPFLLIPMIIGLLVGFFFSGGWAAFVYLGLIGATMGFSSTIKSALWAEMYGTKVIGTVQSAFASLMVFSTALSPFLVGWLLDQSVTMNSILMIAVISSVLAGIVSLKIMPVFSRK
ncbi:MFS transporter [Rhodohalobacter sulfatireducens]|uniref:MFS transporter n=1 Tax=Rhodohalobacter sulfatireducens TaxID=2911366 RepID=A0ABS9KGH5_9BACT|nr:MFS transporter [Rhodohalobacter sulfatireducens]MCG2589958.1 MFS transporter [Rhodohalobacter sulfatireducens]